MSPLALRKRYKCRLGFQNKPLGEWRGSAEKTLEGLASNLGLARAKGYITEAQYTPIRMLLKVASDFIYDLKNAQELQLKEEGEWKEIESLQTALYEAF